MAVEESKWQWDPVKDKRKNGTAMRLQTSWAEGRRKRLCDQGIPLLQLREGEEGADAKEEERSRRSRSRSRRMKRKEKRWRKKKER
jgi:hypothetical protein